MTHITLTGRSPAQLSNAISDAIHAALKRGMGTDEACSVAAAVVADYARAEYGNAFLAKLCAVIIDRGTMPLRVDAAAANPAAAHLLLPKDADHG